MPAVFATLNDKSIPMETRLSIAWDTVRSMPTDPYCEDQVAAKCWLTYRIVDGAFDVFHWPELDGIKPKFINSIGLELRWRISQWMAEIYLQYFRYNDRETAKYRAMSIIEHGWTLSQWPGCLLNFLRASAIAAMLETDAENRYEIIDLTLRHWQRITGSFDVVKYPMRFVEMREDLPVLWQLLAIGKQCGYVNYEPFDWLPKLNTSNDLFAQLMHKLGAPGM